MKLDDVRTFDLTEVRPAAPLIDSKECFQGVDALASSGERRTQVLGPVV